MTAMATLRTETRYKTRDGTWGPWETQESTYTDEELKQLRAGGWRDGQIVTFDKDPIKIMHHQRRATLV